MPAKPAAPTEDAPAASVFDPLFRDPALWPLLIVAILSLSAFGAALVALTFADRNLFAMAALALAAGMSLFMADSEWRRTRRARVPLVVTTLWITSFALGLAYLAAFPS